MAKCHLKEEEEENNRRMQITYRAVELQDPSRKRPTQGAGSRRTSEPPKHPQKRPSNPAPTVRRQTRVGSLRVPLYKAESSRQAAPISQLAAPFQTFPTRPVTLPPRPAPPRPAPPRPAPPGPAPALTHPGNAPSTVFQGTVAVSKVPRHLRAATALEEPMNTISQGFQDILYKRHGMMTELNGSGLRFLEHPDAIKPPSDTLGDVLAIVGLSILLIVALSGIFGILLLQTIPLWPNRTTGEQDGIIHGLRGPVLLETASEAAAERASPRQR